MIKGIVMVVLAMVVFFDTSRAQWDRMRTTTPPYGLEKVQRLIKKIKSFSADDGNDDHYIAAMDKKTFETLTLREQFTYQMIYAEDFLQNCGGWFPDAQQGKKIYGNLPDAFGDAHWSDWQLQWLKDNRDSVMGLIRESIGRTGKLGLNFKLALIEINGTEMIPLLIETYQKDRKDRDILTVLLSLMKKNKYPPFMSSASYRKLYAVSDVSFYDVYLDYNAANEELIFQRATDFYKGLYH